MFNYAIPLFNMISNEKVPNFNMFRPRVKYLIFREIYGNSVVAFYRDSTKINYVIT